MHAMIKTFFLFVVLFGLFGLIGWVLGGGNMMTIIIFLVLAGIMNIFTYFYSDKIILRSYKVKIINERESPNLYGIVAKVASDSNIPLPKVGIIPMTVPNAFATGRNKKNAVVCVTSGILDYLSKEELEGVLAHEMAHVKDRNILVMTIAATVAGAIAIFARMAYLNLFFGRSRQNGLIIIIAAITAPIAAAIIQLAISRTREYKADREGSLATQKPWALARALKKLENGNKRGKMKKGNPASASLFIINPFRGGSFIKLFSTHPSTADRIKKLNKMSEKMGGPIVYMD